MDKKRASVDRKSVRWEVVYEDKLQRVLAFGHWHLCYNWLEETVTWKWLK
jgi:hypothetical protein